MNEQPREAENMAHDSAETSRRLRRRILIVLGCILAVIVLAAVLVVILGGLGEDERVEEHTVNVKYEDVNPALDIMKDEEYLAYDRNIYFCDDATGVTVMLKEDEVASYGPAMVLLRDMIRAVIAGDAETYNECFSPIYYETNEPHAGFAQQQVYDICFTYLESGEKTEEGRSYTQYVFAVKYRIHKNNGTFRRDLGHDDARVQYFVITNRTGDAYLVDQIGYSYNQDN